MFLPTTRASAPTISTVERLVVASATTSTEVVPFSRSKLSPSSTSLPSYWNKAKLVSSFARTLRVTAYVVEVPSSAVTRTLRSLSPSCRLLLPVIETDAPASLGIAVTATAVVPDGTITVPPSVTRAPETLKTTKELMLDGV